MKVSPAHSRKGLGKKLLQHVLNEATKRRYQQLKLETGSMTYFEPARKFYKQSGFTECEPFGDYVKDPNNVFMSLELKKRLFSVFIFIRCSREPNLIAIRKFYFDKLSLSAH